MSHVDFYFSIILVLLLQNQKMKIIPEAQTFHPSVYVASLLFILLSGWSFFLCFVFLFDFYWLYMSARYSAPLFKNAIQIEKENSH